MDEQFIHIKPNALVFHSNNECPLISLGNTTNTQIVLASGPPKKGSGIPVLN